MPAHELVSVAVTAKLNRPLFVGVPDKRPPPDKCNPPGSAPLITANEYGAAPLLEVRDANGKEILIPFAKAICVKVDVAAKRIEADLPEGLLDE